MHSPAANTKFWEKMDARPRMAISELKKSDIPIEPGAYALYRDARRMYVGKAASLQSRIWNNHCGKGSVMTGSALRRNIAEHLEIATPADIKSGRYIPTTQDLSDVRAWLEQSEIAWMACGSHDDAKSLEAHLKAEYLPPLTKR